MHISPGRHFGHYEIRSQIGAGGMGEVYLAQDTSELERTVAIKLLPPEVVSDPNRMRRFVQEARTVSALNHPNILTIYEFGQEGATRFIATEYVDGVTLREHVGGRRIRLHEVLDIAIQIAAALDAAHEANVVHRDIKPENIMIRHRDHIVKVIDFGLAKPIEKIVAAARPGAAPEAGTTLMVNTEPGVVMGTVSYMSPEQSQGSTGVDHRTDIWSLGAVLYEMVAGRVPFEGKDLHRQVIAIQEQEQPPLSRFAERVPARLEEIVTKTLAKNSNERYQTAKDLLIDLRNLKRKLEVDAEIDRTAPTESPSVSSTSGNQSTPATDSDAAAATAPAIIKPVVSSAEYIVSGIRQHKVASLLVLLMIAAGATGLGFYIRARNTEVAIDSIAVLPFENKSADPDTEYLSDGLAESLMYRLSQLRGLKVSPRSLVLQYKGKEVDPIKIGSQLGVSAVLSGRIVQRGDNLTISVELVDVRHNTLLWGEQYDRKMSELLATQREIAQEITEKLRVKVAGEELKGITKRYTESNEAYQLYLKGRFYWNKRRGEALKKSIEYFNQAIEKDPHFALAYAGLADCYVVPANPLPPREKMPKAKVAAMRALELDDTLAEAHATLARTMTNYDWDWTGAEKELKRAIALNADYAIAHQWYGGYLEAMGRRNEAIAEAKRAQELDPLSPILSFELGMASYYNRDYDQAIAYLQKTLELDPDFPPAHGQLPAAFEQKGMYDKAIAGFQKGITLRGGSEWYFSFSGLGHVYAVSGKTSEAQVMLNELKQLSEREYVPADGIALIYAGLGEKDQAFAWLEKAYGERSFNLAWLKVEPRWDGLRSDPRFADLVRRVGLPQ